MSKEVFIGRRISYPSELQSRIVESLSEFEGRIITQALVLRINERISSMALIHKELI